VWQFDTQTGLLSQDGSAAGMGYSGFGSDKDNPAAQNVPDCGPIPEGLWQLGTATSQTHLGPIAIPLTPLPQTTTFGRTGFWIHGDSVRHPGQGSHGCIVLPRPARAQIANSGDDLLYAGPNASESTQPPPETPPTQTTP
jgi:hypothetical protein